VTAVASGPGRGGVGRLGVGIGWRPELDLSIERLPGVDFVEVVADDLDPRALPAALVALRGRGVPMLAHAVGLSLGGAEPLDRARVAHLAAVADALGSPVVSDHIAFTRAGGLDTGHLLPVPRSRASLDVLVEHVREAQAELPAPLAVENIASLMSWPGSELTEVQFLTELLDRTGCLLLLDVANLYADACNLGLDVGAFLAGLPLERLAYVHVAGGLSADGLYHDTHAHPVPSPVFEVLAALCGLVDPPGVLLERDDRYPADAELAAELEGIRSVIARSARARSWRAPPLTAVSAAASIQAALVHALVAGGEPPAGFDPDRIARQAAALRSKRRRVIARLRPDVETALGGGFADHFDAWAREHPPLVGSCAGVDADAFAAWLVRAGFLPGPRTRLRRERLSRRRPPSRTSG
jgi:uncharacterized protein (UPF0276 family)